MTGPGPFRAEDPEARARSLRGQRDALAEELSRIHAELAAHRPWSAARFAIGFGVVLVGFFVVATAAVWVFFH